MCIVIALDVTRRSDWQAQGPAICFAWKSFRIPSELCRTDEWLLVVGLDSQAELSKALSDAARVPSRYAVASTTIDGSSIEADATFTAAVAFRVRCQAEVFARRAVQETGLRTLATTEEAKTTFLDFLVVRPRS